MGPGRASTILSVCLILALLVWFWLRGERFIAANGPTFDEGAHLAAGYSYWATGDFHLNLEDPPLLKLLWALPSTLGDAPAFPAEHAATTTNHWQIADEWLYRGGTSIRSLFDPARRVNLAIGCCVVLLVAWCAYRILGSKLAAIAACGFAVTDPTLLALSCILSTDAGLTFFCLLTCYLMWEYVNAPSRGFLLGTGISLGLLLATKFSAVGIAIGLGIAGLAHLYLGGTLSLPGKEGRRGLRPALELAIRLGVISIVTIAATYGFIHFDEWGKGLKFQLTRGSHGDGVMYLNGELSRQGWFHYFVVALFVKLPLGLLIAALISAGIQIYQILKSKLLQDCSASVGEISRRSSELRTSNKYRDLWMVLPPLVFFILASCSRVDMGIRVVLPVLPFLYLLASILACTKVNRPLCFMVLFGCLIWCSVITECANPHEIAYFNELASCVPRETPILADSNLDWGQGLPTLRKWMESENVEFVYLAYFGTDRPEVYGIHYRQLPGYGRVGLSGGELKPRNAVRPIAAVSANHLYGLFINDANLYSWLRLHKPITTLDGSIYVFDLTDDPEAVARISGLPAQ